MKVPAKSAKNLVARPLNYEGACFQLGAYEIDLRTSLVHVKGVTARFMKAPVSDLVCS